MYFKVLNILVIGPKQYDVGGHICFIKKHFNFLNTSMIFYITVVYITYWSTILCAPFYYLTARLAGPFLQSGRSNDWGGTPPQLN